MSTDTVSEVQRARQFLMGGHANEAIQVLRTFLQHDTTNAEAYELMGAALNMVGNHEQGIACLEHAVVMEPHRASYHFNYGCALEQKGDLMHAIEQYRLAVQEDPNHTRAAESLRRAEIALLNPGGGHFAQH
jgi:Tfp pilus assembly protein PilF